MTSLKMITQERLKELVLYDPESGSFTCLIRRGGTNKKGREIGSKDHGYIRITIDGKRYYAHRLAWLYITGEWPLIEIDHANCVRDDNRWCNLREANKTQNGGNVRKKSNNTSGIKGIYWNKYREKWTAEIMIEQKKIHLGHFTEFNDAVIARHLADARYFGEYMRIDLRADIP